MYVHVIVVGPSTSIYVAMFSGALKACSFCCTINISDCQRLLSRSEGLIERSFEIFQECDYLTKKCGKEIELLRDERKRLLNRVKEIDSDLHEVLSCTVF